jgi:O-acetyl-ADP-ribose deacetylase (regulator of RNase III)
MIHQLSGDILYSGAKAIVHGVAQNDDFLHGLTLQLRERMPAMYKEFRHYCQTKHPKSGGLCDWMSPDGHRIINLFTRDAAYDHGSKPGQASLSHVNHALHALRVLVHKEAVSSLASSRLRHDWTGLDWNDVAPLI